MSEQKTVVESVGVKTSDVDDVVGTANREIELLHEYRARLIADVVTGKLDVCEAAAALPEVDPLAAEDEPDDPFAAEPEFDNEEELSAAEY